MLGCKTRLKSRRFTQVSRKFEQGERCYNVRRTGLPLDMLVGADGRRAMHIHRDRGRVAVHSLVVVPVTSHAPCSIPDDMMDIMFVNMDFVNMDILQRLVAFVFLMSIGPATMR